MIMRTQFIELQELHTHVLNEARSVGRCISLDTVSISVVAFPQDETGGGDGPNRNPTLTLLALTDVCWLPHPRLGSDAKRVGGSVDIRLQAGVGTQS